MTPVPISPAAGVGRPRRSSRAARAAEAAVRRALISELSRIASGSPVWALLRISTAEARARPFSRLPGNEATHFIPATSKPSPR